MSASDVAYTNLIAAHRIHVERRIGRIKEFNLVIKSESNYFQSLLQFGLYVCSLLTNFQNNILKNVLTSIEAKSVTVIHTW